MTGPNHLAGMPGQPEPQAPKPKAPVALDPTYVRGIDALHDELKAAFMGQPYTAHNQAVMARVEKAVAAVKGRPAR